MNKIVLILLLAAVSGNAVAEWVKVTASNVGISGGITVYADPNIVPKYSHRVKMWEMHDSRLPNSSNTSSKKRVEYDCTKKQARQLQATYYFGSMGKGGIFMNIAEPGQWEAVLPGTENQEMLNFACKNR
ncbi:MAG: hypothetical protein PHP70_10345 [Gallionella sp.]|nr:hypothetical protein [Gallionella sp.]